MLAQMYYQTHFLTPTECQSLIEYYNANLDKVYRGKFRYPPYAEVNLQRKVSKIVNLELGDNEDFQKIYQRVADLAKFVNDEKFRFDVDWESSSELPTAAKVVKYEGEEKGHWARHQNVNWMSNDKQFKIVASILLSEDHQFEGGDNVYFFGDTNEKPSRKDDRTQGTLCIYPAFRVAQTNPVLSGNKYTLDFVFEGPCWK